MPNRLPTADNTAPAGGHAALLDTDIAKGLTEEEARARQVRLGTNEVPEKKEHPLFNFLRKFWGLSAWMIELIALVSFALHKYADLGVALALLLVNAILSFLQEERANAAVKALRHSLQVKARVRRDGSWRISPSRELVPGDVVRIRAGDFVPADLLLAEGTLKVDQSALTGESRLLDKAAHDTVYSGSIVSDGEATGIVAAIGVNTFFGRTTELVQSARPKLHIETVVSRLVTWLLLIVGALVALTVVLSISAGSRLLDILPISLVLLMSAVPVALPVMFTVSMAVGSLELARKGVLITRLSAAEDAANLDTLCADKTGTLTLNRLELAGVRAFGGTSEDDVIRDGARASRAADADPIDSAFLRVAEDKKLRSSDEKRVSFTPFSPATRHTEAVIAHNGVTLRVAKGALHAVAELVRLEESDLSALEAGVNEAAAKGYRAIAVARAEGDGPWHLEGIAYLADAPRPDSRALIDELRSLGVSVKMLTGDALPVAREIARELGLGEVLPAATLHGKDGQDAPFAHDLVADGGGFAEVYPEDKYRIVKGLQAADHVVGMTGDGVNDAPALRQAEVGIAVSGATDVAKSAASVVLTTEGLAGIADLIKSGRAIYQRVLTWIVNKISSTILKAGFVVAAFLVTGKFVISALGMVLLVFMTDFVKVALATDNVRPSRAPETWNIGPLVRVAIVIGILMVIEAGALLAYGWTRFGLGDHPGELQTFTFQTLLFFSMFSIVSIRERRAFWRSAPSAVFNLALAADGLAGIFIGVFGLGDLKPIPPMETALVAAYALVCSFGINDPAKLVAIRAVSVRH